MSIARPVETLAQRSGLVLGLAKLLYSNGQTTDQTIAAARQLGAALGLRADILPRWGELQVRSEDLRTGESDFSLVTANPTGVDMERVAAAMRLTQDLCTGRQSPVAAMQMIGEIGRRQPAPSWLFALAAGAGAVALAVLFGVERLSSAALIFVSAATGAVLRRWLARLSTNIFLQPACAALLAGIIGAVAVRYDLSSSLRLVAVCPCMVLVPGPHVLNGALDLVEGRMHLGATRMIYAGLVVVAISTGLLLGLSLLGVSLPVDESSRPVPLWQDLIAAGVAVAAYSVFFSTPLRMLAWPVSVGMLAHALRWVVMTQASVALGDLVACFVAGLILTPVARRWHMPFAAIGFASVVSMIPGVLLFRMANGLVLLADGSHTTPELVGATISSGMSAIIIIMAMSFGLLLPRSLIHRLAERSHSPRS